MKLKKTTAIIFLTLFMAASCRGTENDAPAGTPAETTSPAPTEAPAAARVNGEIIPLSEYEAELMRYQAGLEQLGKPFDPAQAQQEVVDMLVAQTLFAQAAHTQGFAPDEGELQSKLDGYSESLGGQAAFDAWMVENYYDIESFRDAVARDMSAIWARNALLEQVPVIADQVHARQILLDTENEAIGVQRQLQVGTSFKDLAFQYDPLTGGELGWFPSGYLLQPDVEAAAFALQPGQYSAIIPTSYGYHLVEVIERDAEHPLSQDALLFIQRKALEDWLENQTAVSEIDVLLP